MKQETRPPVKKHTYIEQFGNRLGSKPECGTRHACGGTGIIRGRRNAGRRAGGDVDAKKYLVPTRTKALPPFFQRRMCAFALRSANTTPRQTIKNTTHWTTPAEIRERDTHSLTVEFRVAKIGRQRPMESPESDQHIRSLLELRPKHQTRLLHIDCCPSACSPHTILPSRSSLSYILLFPLRPPVVSTPQRLYACARHERKKKQIAPDAPG